MLPAWQCPECLPWGVAAPLMHEGCIEEAHRQQVKRAVEADLCGRCLKATCPGTCVGVSPHDVEKCGAIVLAPGYEDMRTGEEDPPAFLRCSSEAGHAGPVHVAKLLDGTVWRWFLDNTGKAVAANETWRTEGMRWAL